MALLAQVPAEALERADNSFALSALFAAILLVFGLVGALVASRLPANPIGWLFLALALIEGVYELAFGYAHLRRSLERAARRRVGGVGLELDEPAVAAVPDRGPAAVPRRPAADAALALGRCGCARSSASPFRCSTRSRPARSTSSRR